MEGRNANYSIGMIDETIDLGRNDLLILKIGALKLQSIAQDLRELTLWIC